MYIVFPSVLLFSTVHETNKRMYCILTVTVGEVCSKRSIRKIGVLSSRGKCLVGEVSITPTEA